MYVILPVYYARLAGTVWIFWDHVPVWLRATGEGRVLFSEQESTSYAERKRLSRKTKDAVAQYFAGLEGAGAEPTGESELQLQELLQEAKGLAEASGTVRPVQTRGVYSQGGDKYRLTLILFQSIEQWFNPGATPVGRAEVRSQKDQSQASLQGILIVYGSVHCRLEDLDDSGRFCRDYQFKVKGRLIERVQGQSARGLMGQWLQLRNQLGHQQFQQLRVWCQPAAWADEVISCWISDLLAELVWQSINAVDCFSGQWTEATLHTAWLNNQFQIPVGPDTTPLLQVTDTCISAQAKSAGEREKEAIAMQLREVARREAVPYKAKFGPFELLRVASAMAGQGSRQQLTRDVVLGQAVKSQLLVWRPNSSGHLEPIEQQSWSAPFPRFPFQSGLQSNWVKLRSAHMQCAEGASPVPPIPDWDKLGEGMQEEQCMPVEPAPQELQLEVLPETVLSQLTDLDREMLKSPQERWASLRLHPSLKSQADRKKAEKRSSRWGSKLHRTFLRKRSKQWQNLQECGSGERPVPSAGKGSKRQAEQPEGTSGQSHAKASKRHRLWKGSRSKGTVPRQQEAQTPEGQQEAPVFEVVENSDWLGETVRTVDDRLPSGYLGREWKVQQVRRSPVSGEEQLRLQSETLAVCYALTSQVVRASAEADCTPRGPAVLDYRHFGAAQRKQSAKQLCPDVQLIKPDQLVEANSLAWGLNEIQRRLPCSGLEIVHCAEAATVCAWDLDHSASEQQQQLEMVGRLDKASRVLVLLHSGLGQHYTLLERLRVGEGQYQLRYWDSLQPSSALSMQVAQKFVDQLQWNLPVPPPVNHRYQPDGWSCGLFSLHFLEEAVRQHRGEALWILPVNVATVMARVNRFIQAVRQHLPAKETRPAGPSMSAVAQSAREVLDQVQSSAARAAEEAQGPSVATSAESAQPPLPPPAAPPTSADEYTIEQAEEAKSRCAKCRQQGCRRCMKQYFIPRSFWKKSSAQSHDSDASAIA